MLNYYTILNFQEKKFLHESLIFTQNKFKKTKMDKKSFLKMLGEQ
jgi:hypothetical protein